jgi:hypothetical protein
VIPTFPEFKLVALEDREAIEAHTCRFEPYSDFNFTSLWAWDTSEARLISDLEGNLVVRFTDYRTHEPFFSFLGTNECERTAQTLTSYATAQGITPKLRLMPAVSIANLNPKWCVEEDRDNFDYVYSVREHVLLAGPDFKRARNFVSRFLREHSTTRVEMVDLADKNVQERVMEVIRAWEASKIESGKTYELGHELAAMQRLFSTTVSRLTFLTGVFSGDVMLGISIDELLPDRYCISHFCKADISHAGIYDFLVHKKAKYLESRGVVLMNHEQDLGVDGLRRSKCAYRPVRFLKKYVVSKV